MELWIRSQDNWEMDIVPRLIKVNEIALDYCGENDGYYISINNGIEVGYYHTNKRAIEVLDEIQEYLERECRKEEIDFEMNGVQHSSMRYAIYEMPKE